MVIPQDIAEQHSRMVYLAMRKGNHERCVNIVFQAFQLAAERDQRVITNNSPIAQLVGPPLSSLLEEGGVLTIGDLVNHTPQDLNEFRHVSWRRISIIQELLANHGKCLAKLS